MTTEIEFSLVSTMLAVAVTSTFSESEPTCIATLIWMLLLTCSTSAGLHVVLETGTVHFEPVGSNGKVREHIAALGIGDGRANQAFGDFRHRDLRVDDYVARRIPDDAVYRRHRSGLRIQLEREE